ncbi:Putative short-chain dehydrogenase/reductase SDR, NAD(P)-binding domain superfamily [Septoria linicola]|uniref:Short-chain dehydrogenase/reductase SDR, NAD(P)-binding domain superfamily n=1 Tax=Septoria linicola TaxID=215465 RepID=A0A9Q9AS34_9PEZI|nr:Putative short-chain dehydrogenase/reductase SDR, NAD(P)-binding domain superfamily [Septoria linicola]
MANHVTSGRGKSWHNHLTIDLFAHVLANSIFHPFIAWLIPLCLRSLQAPYESTEFIASCGYAGVVTLFWILSVINKRFAYGLPRTIDWDDEVVVITGGANGLGKIIAQTYGMRGASVAVLDIVEPEKESEGLAGVKYYHCDIGNADAVAKAAAAIQEDLNTPTILINNAGIVNGKAIWDLTEKDVQRNMNVNLISHFNTIRTFLPGMLASDTGGTIVTVASVLGKLGAGNLSDYCAAKAGLIAMHTSLRSDLSSLSAPEGARDIRTVLVTPGQLSTQLFADLETPSNFFGPVVETVELAKAIVQKIDAGESGEVSLPFYTRWIEWNHVLPATAQKVLRLISGIDRAMGMANTRAAKKK